MSSSSSSSESAKISSIAGYCSGSCFWTWDEGSQQWLGTHTCMGDLEHECYCPEVGRSGNYDGEIVDSIPCTPV